MFIDNLNLNHLRIFERVYRTGSMTTAAAELHLTQSGVSQHMRAFEDAIELKLFDRIKQKLVPTAIAAELFKSCSHGLLEIEQTLVSLKGTSRELSGTVGIGMPIEFGNNVILPLLSEFGKKHPRVRFELRYGFATEMNAGVLGGDLDFAFFDEYGLDPRIHVEKVFDEELYLCGLPELARRLPLPKSAAKNPKAMREYYESLEYVDYQTGEPILRMWFRHHFKTRDLRLNVRATVMDVQGVARFILLGLAAGVLPGHLLQKLEQEGKKLHIFKGTGKVLRNGIRVGYLPERTHSATARAVLDTLVKGTRGGA